MASRPTFAVTLPQKAAPVAASVPAVRLTHVTCKPAAGDKAVPK